MKLFDHMVRNPICFDGETRKRDYDASSLIAGAMVFDVNEIASQMIESVTNNPDNTTATKFTQHGLRWMNFDKNTLRTEFVGIILPYENCFFEYDGVDVQYGVHFVPLEKEGQLGEMFADDRFADLILFTVFIRPL